MRTVKASGAFSIKLTCTGNTTCAGKVRLFVKKKVKKGKKTKTVIKDIATASFSIPAGETQAVTIKLNATGRALLHAAHGHLSASVTITKSSPSPSKASTLGIHLNQQTSKKK